MEVGTRTGSSASWPASTPRPKPKPLEGRTSEIESGLLQRQKGAVLREYLSTPPFIQGISKASEMAKELKNAPTPDKDYSDFFRDPELTDKYPGVELPPATFVAHQGKIFTFASGQSL